jgi:hypothetical protein
MDFGILTMVTHMGMASSPKKAPLHTKERERERERERKNNNKGGKRRRFSLLKKTHLVESFFSFQWKGKNVAGKRAGERERERSTWIQT